MTWISEGTNPRGAHECSPPTAWPFLRQRKHRDGAIWLCDATVPYGQGESPFANYCGRRWQLEWTMPWGETTPEWTLVEPRTPGPPPAGRAGVSSR